MTQRGRRRYDWWSDHQVLFGALSRVAFLGRESAFRAHALDALGLRPDETVLDVGCGPGVNFDSLASAVGPAGRVLGLDYSDGMVRSARATADGDRVAVLRADATRLPVADGSADAAYATLSLSAMSDAPAAVAAVHRALGPGGRFVVLDGRPFQATPLRWLNPVVERVSRAATNWHPEHDLTALLEATFETVAVDSFNAGTVVVARAEKGG